MADDKRLLARQSLDEPKWEIEKEEFLRRLDCTERKFREELCLPDFKKVEKVVPLRYIEKADAAVHFTRDMVARILSHTKTLGGAPVFSRSKFHFCKVDPNNLKTGQRFVYREKYQNLLENLPDLFGKFATARGINDLEAHFIFGRDKRGFAAIACYIPPIIELCGNDLVIMDGIHRNYISKQMGTAMNAILVFETDAPFPCSARPWEETRVIALKDKPPELENRYFDLNAELFRDLKYLGIDG